MALKPLPLAIAAFGLFMLLALAVAGGAVHAPDAALSTALREPLPLPVDRLLLALTMMGDGRVMTPASVVVVAVLLWQRRWQAALAFALGMLAVAVCVPALKMLFAVPRPVAFYDGRQLYSFPSQHAAGAATFWGMMAVVLAAARTRRRRWGIATAAGLLIAVTALSRIHLGAHWPSDVIGGVLFGLGLSALFAFGVHQPPAALPRWPAVLMLLGWLLVGGWHVTSGYAANQVFYGRDAPISELPQEAP